ncbi:MAG TPA: YceI family protein [Chitinophagaceae bacterium]|nr:YceI family protein [Chitinophagaceae bacterium]
MAFVKKYAPLLACLFMASSGFYDPGDVYQTTNGKIAFKSEAPLELIKASSDQLNGLLDADKKSFSFKVSMRSFQGFNSPLQKEHFNENYVESDKYPIASFSGKIIEDVNLAAEGTYDVRAKGTFTIHGVQQERIIKSQLTVKNKKISIKSGFTVLLSDHNIPIPKVVYQKLANEINVDISATLELR